MEDAKNPQEIDIITPEIFDALVASVYRSEGLGDTGKEAAFSATDIVHLIQTGLQQLTFGSEIYKLDSNQMKRQTQEFLDLVHSKTKQLQADEQKAQETFLQAINTLDFSSFGPENEIYKQVVETYHLDIVDGLSDQKGRDVLDD